MDAARYVSYAFSLVLNIQLVAASFHVPNSTLQLTRLRPRLLVLLSVFYPLCLKYSHQKMQFLMSLLFIAPSPILMQLCNYGA